MTTQHAPILMHQFVVERLPTQLTYRQANGFEIWSEPRTQLVEWRYCRFGTNYQPRIVKDLPQ